MSKPIAELLSDVQPDPWREAVGFSPELEEANQGLFNTSLTEPELIDIVSRWIQKHQPCLFGRIAAKCGFLSYCILTEADLEGSDESIREKVQDARSTWTREAFEGKKNGFIILAISERLAYAIPDETLKQFALRLCSLYLLEGVVPDQVFLDEIFLEMPGSKRTTWKWHAGVNYFSAQGDKRWWQDHRIPGGMGYSVNSVGHMVKSDILAKAMVELESVLDVAAEGWDRSKVESLGKALELAMRTISLASEGPSGKATMLLTLPEDSGSASHPKRPVDLPHSLADKNHCDYLGRYHTDYTVPSEYFRPDVERPPDVPNHILDFPYLFHQNIGNPDFITMGAGRRIRADEIIGTAEAGGLDFVPTSRWNKMTGLQGNQNVCRCPQLNLRRRSRWCPKLNRQLQQLLRLSLLSQRIEPFDLFRCQVSSQIRSKAVVVNVEPNQIARCVIRLTDNLNDG